MDIVIEAVKKLESLLEHSGCENGDVLLDVNPDAVNCRYENGACMSATFGGRIADFTTFEPIRARTKISFMFGAPLDTLPVRSAACAIVNVATGFFCLSRVLHACPLSSHDTCIERLRHELAGKNVWCAGNIPAIESEFRHTISGDPSEADILLIGSEGIIAPGTGDLIEIWRKTRRIICIGPSTAGIARLHELELFCPCGKS
ncbi:hypothetical protein [uncultured Methanoregula sp.]|uniref:hypothetical protein n=1 Tax=uncultured Methanoregula sp. TaxID=1005933 RepID=UPI002AABFB51|nr:hypothetical protein [uncultured Methanoregula sp.]